jgi:ABC-type nitrate/sulfonate/bicarbonate transport system substrate-binding protein
LFCFFTVTMSVATEKTVVRVGHFPNITHVQGLVAHNLSRQGKGWFEARLGPGVEIQWFTYNAGPSAMEAIFAKSIELTYVGPGPALDASSLVSLEPDNSDTFVSLPLKAVKPPFCRRK